MGREGHAFIYDERETTQLKHAVFYTIGGENASSIVSPWTRIIKCDARCTIVSVFLNPTRYSDDSLANRVS